MPSKPSKKKAKEKVICKSKTTTAEHVSMTKSQLESKQEYALELERQLTEYCCCFPSNSKNQEHPEVKVNSIRSELCQVLANLLLMDAVKALEWNVDARLWKLCFYNRIQPLRLALDKKTTKKKTHFKSSSSFSNSNNEEEEEGKIEPRVTMERALIRFLSESVTFYDFMIQKLVQQLKQLKQDQPKPIKKPLSSSSSSSSSMGAAIVELLYRLHLCLGDLFRYSSAGAGGYGASSSLRNVEGLLPLLQKAHGAYQTAACLGYGRGHAYNQLAMLVLKQQQPSVSLPGDSPQEQQGRSDVLTALYWYVRGLGASTFCNTSSATDLKQSAAWQNMMRLLQENQARLLDRAGAAVSGTTNNKSAEQEQQPQPPPPSPPPGRIAGCVSPSALGLHHHLLAPVLQTRQFLCEWVDLHRCFLLLSPSNYNRNDDDDSTKQVDYESSTMRQREKVMGTFRSLLQASAFGNALLVKMVCIQLWSDYYWMATTSSQDENYNWAAAARTATFHLGVCLADQVLRSSLSRPTSASSQQLNGNNSNKLPSSRLLVPLLLLSEYLGATAQKAKKRDCHQRKKVSWSLRWEEEMRFAFWERLVQVWNLVSQHFGPHLEEAAVAAVPEEYQSLRGFAPLESSLLVSVTLEEEDDMNSSRPGFVSEDKALAILTTASGKATGATTTASPPDSNPSSSASSSQQQQTLVVARRMLQVAARITESNPDIDWNENGAWQWYAPAMNVLVMTAPPEPTTSTTDQKNKDKGTEKKVEDGESCLFIPAPPATTTSKVSTERPKQEPDNNCKDSAEDEILLYQPSPRGGPDLLVPRFLLQSSAMAAEPFGRTPPLPLPPSPAGTCPQGDVISSTTSAVVEMDHILGPLASTMPTAPTPAFASVASTPGIGPPPGFAGFSSATSFASNQALQQRPEGALLPPRIAAPMLSTGNTSLSLGDHVYSAASSSMTRDFMGPSRSNTAFTAGQAFAVAPLHFIPGTFNIAHPTLGLLNQNLEASDNAPQYYTSGFAIPPASFSSVQSGMVSNVHSEPSSLLGTFNTFSVDTLSAAGAPSAGNGIDEGDAPLLGSSLLLHSLWGTEGINGHSLLGGERRQASSSSNTPPDPFAF